jgi:hypothetical protein
MLLLKANIWNTSPELAIVIPPIELTIILQQFKKLPDPLVFTSK